MSQSGRHTLGYIILSRPVLLVRLAYDYADCGLYTILTIKYLPVVDC